MLAQLTAAANECVYPVSGSNAKCDAMKQQRMFIVRHVNACVCHGFVCVFVWCCGKGLGVPGEGLLLYMFCCVVLVTTTESRCSF